MKYIIPQDKIEKVVFKYLDLNLKGLIKQESEYYDGFVFAYPDNGWGIIGYQEDGTLLILRSFYSEVYSFFGLEISVLEPIIIKWASDRYQLDIKEIIPITFEDSLKVRTEDN
jgi:hypothetical protein